MKFGEYLWFWRMSWDYMKGSRRDFWFGLPKATYEYRKSIVDSKKREKEFIDKIQKGS